MNAGNDLTVRKLNTNPLCYINKANISFCVPKFSQKMFKGTLASIMANKCHMVAHTIVGFQLASLLQDTILPMITHSV